MKRKIICLVLALLLCATLVFSGCGAQGFVLSTGEQVLAAAREDIVVLDEMILSVKNAKGTTLALVTPGMTYAGQFNHNPVFVDSTAATYEIFDTTTGTMQAPVSVTAVKGMSVTSMGLVGTALWTIVTGPASQLRKELNNNKFCSGALLTRIDLATGTQSLFYAIGGEVTPDVTGAVTLLAVSETECLSEIMTKGVITFCLTPLTGKAGTISFTVNVSSSGLVSVPLVGVVPTTIKGASVLSYDKKALTHVRTAQISQLEQLFDNSLGWALTGTENIVQSGAFTVISTPAQLRILDQNNTSVFSAPTDSTAWIIDNSVYYAREGTILRNILGTSMETTCGALQKGSTLLALDVVAGTMTVVVQNKTKILCTQIPLK